MDNVQKHILTFICGFKMFNISNISTDFFGEILQKSVVCYMKLLSGNQFVRKRDNFFLLLYL